MNYGFSDGDDGPKGKGKGKAKDKTKSKSFGSNFDWSELKKDKWTQVQKQFRDSAFLRHKKYPASAAEFYSSRGFTMNSLPLDSFSKILPLDQISKWATYTAARASRLSALIDTYGVEKCDLEMMCKFIGIIYLSANRKGTPIRKFWSTNDLYSWPFIKGTHPFLSVSFPS